jgi:hypothetical protein
VPRALLALGLAVAGLAVFAPPAAALPLLSWVSGVGDDANPCTRTAPCKTWAGAIVKTEPGGEVKALDDGDFGPLIISKAITLNGGGHNVQTLVPAANGIAVNAPAGAQVVLRDFDIKSGNTSVGSCTGLNGVVIVGAASVQLDRMEIAGFQYAVTAPLSNSTGVVDVSLSDVRISDNCQNGVLVAPDAGKSARVTLDHVTITRSGVGLHVGTGGEGWVSNSQVFLNSVGVQPAGTGKIHALCGVSVAANTSNGAFTDSSCGGVVTAPAATYCTVPKLKKKSKTQAAKLLTDAGCALGKVKKQSAPKSKKGKVLSQDVPVGTQVKVGTKVGVVVGK